MNSLEEVINVILALKSTYQEIACERIIERHYTFSSSTWKSFREAEVSNVFRPYLPSQRGRTPRLPLLLFFSQSVSPEQICNIGPLQSGMYTLYSMPRIVCKIRLHNDRTRFILCRLQHIDTINLPRPIHTPSP
jgi:hypothetical protein